MLLLLLLLLQNVPVVTHQWSLTSFSREHITSSPLHVRLAAIL